MTSDQDLFEEWLKDAKRVLSGTTVKRYKGSINHFLKWMKKEGFTLTTVDKKEMKEYCNAVYDTRKANPQSHFGEVTSARIDASIGGRLVALNHLFDFLDYEDRIDRNPITTHLKKRYPSNSQPESYPKIPLDQVRTLYQGLEDQYMKQILVATLVDTGIRPLELCMVDIEHLDIPGRELYVKYGKGRKGQLPRMTILSKTLQGLLKQYLPYREDLPSHELKDSRGGSKESVRQTSEALFTNKLGGRFSVDTLRELWNIHRVSFKVDGKWKKTREFEGSDCHRLGLPRIVPRRFRPTYTTWLRDQRIDEKVEYLQIGHKHRDVHINIYIQRDNKERHTEHERVGSILDKIIR